MTVELPEYLGVVATQLVSELTPILSIKGVTTNTDLLGKYTEASIHRLVHRIVHPMHVSTGAVLDDPIPTPLRQIDLIVWSPFPAPAIFEVGGFALVPKSSAFGVIEVKRSNYSGIEDSLESFISDVKSHKIVATPAGPMADYAGIPGLGVVSVLEAQPSARLQALLDRREAVAIFQRVREDVQVRHRDVLVLVNFLHYVTWRYRVQGSGPSFPQFDTTQV